MTIMGYLRWSLQCHIDLPNIIDVLSICDEFLIIQLYLVENWILIV